MVCIRTNCAMVSDSPVIMLCVSVCVSVHGWVVSVHSSACVRGLSLCHCGAGVCSRETRCTPGLRSGPGSDCGRGNSLSLEKQLPETRKQPKAIAPQGNLGQPPMLTIKMSYVLKTIQEVAKAHQFTMTCSAFKGSE